MTEITTTCNGTKNNGNGCNRSRGLDEAGYCFQHKDQKENDQVSQSWWRRFLNWLEH